jgi:hypothetical protein
MAVAFVARFHYLEGEERTYASRGEFEQKKSSVLETVVCAEADRESRRNGDRLL